MPTESLLRHVSRDLCSPQAWDLVIEPLLADLAFDLGRARTRFRRIAVLMRWSPAVGQALLLCGVRSGVTRLLALLADRDRVVIWSYSVGILLVAGIGPHWVRTGEFSWQASLRGLSRIVPGVPWLFVWSSGDRWPRTTWRQALLRLALLIPVTVLAGALNPAARWSIAMMAAANFLMTLTAGRWWFPRRRAHDHLTIRS